MSISTSIDSAYVLRFLGSTADYDVYDIILYPGIVANPKAQHAYRRALTAQVQRAKAAGRKLWISVDLSRLTPDQLMHLFYRIVLSFAGMLVISKTYGAPTTERFRGIEEFPLIHVFLRWVFHYEKVPHRDAAMPPGFTPDSSTQHTESTCRA